MSKDIRFDSLGLRPYIANSLVGIGFEEMTPVQQEVIPVALEGRDILATAQTGTGKTAAYVIPILQSGSRGLILAPTRELALQVQDDFNRMCGGAHPSVCLIGGAPIRDQKRALRRRPESNIVATPGRLCDHINQGTVDISNIEIFVLDEADEMLSMGFSDELDRITAALPETRQTLLLAATMPKSVKRLANAALNNPVHISAGSGPLKAADTVNQTVLIVPKRKRSQAIERLLVRYDPEACIIFCRTRNRTEELAKELSHIGAESLHGGYQQKHRDNVMSRFRNGKSNLLVATDVAARGLDVETIDLVIQDDMPQNSEVYVHRVGRTGRAGREGRSILLISKGVSRRIGMLAKVAGHLAKEPLPTSEEVEELHTLRLIDEMMENKPSRMAKTAYEAALKSNLSPEQIALAAIEMLVGDIEVEEKKKSSSSAALALKVGKMDHVRAKDLVGLLCHEGGIKGDKIGRIDLLDRISVIEVPHSEIDSLVSALANTKIRGRWLKPRQADDWEFAKR